MHFLDGVEVGAVGREEAQGCASRFDQLAHRSTLVTRQIVHDDDIAGPQHGDEHLSDIGFEPVAVDRSVEHHRCTMPVRRSPATFVVVLW